MNFSMGLAVFFIVFISSMANATGFQDQSDFEKHGSKSQNNSKYERANSKNKSESGHSEGKKLNKHHNKGKHKGRHNEEHADHNHCDLHHSRKNRMNIKGGDHAIIHMVRGMTHTGMVMDMVILDIIIMNAL